MDTSSVRIIKPRTLAIWAAVNAGLSAYFIYGNYMMAHGDPMVDVGQFDVGVASMIVIVAVPLVGLI